MRFGLSLYQPGVGSPCYKLMHDHVSTMTEVVAYQLSYSGCLSLGLTAGPASQQDPLPIESCCIAIFLILQTLTMTAQCVKKQTKTGC